MLNRVTVQGRLTADPETAQTANGKLYAKFTVAWSEKYGDGDQENTLFLPCTAWGKLAETVQKYFSKGKEAVAEGRLRTESWQDKEGNNRSRITCTIDRIHFCGKKGDGGGYNNAETPQVGVETIPIDNLPF